MGFCSPTPFGFQPTHRSRCKRFGLCTRSSPRLRRLKTIDGQPAALDAIGVCVHVEAVVTQEADDRLTEAFGGRDREARRRGHRAQHRDAGDRGLLDELERQPARHEEHFTRERERPLEQRRADQLVERVVPPDVLAHGDEVTGRGEAGGRVQATRLAEEALVLGEPRRQRPHHRSRDKRAGSDGIAPHLEVVERGLAADPAGGVGEEPAFADLGDDGPAQPQRHHVEELLAFVAEAIRDGVDVARRGDEPLGAAEPGSQLEVVARRAHRHRERARRLTGSVHAQLERLLGDELVGSRARRLRTDRKHLHGGHGPANRRGGRIGHLHCPMLRAWSAGVSMSSNTCAGAAACHTSSATSSHSVGGTALNDACPDAAAARNHTFP